MRNFVVIFIFIFFANIQSYSQELKKTYFGGGCFWCMEEAFDKVDGVTNVVSGYSGGTKPNPTYKEVTYGDTGHIEVVEITYDTNKISYEELLNVFWKNIVVIVYSIFTSSPPLPSPSTTLVDSGTTGSLA